MGRRWTKEEDEFLVKEMAAGASISSICRVLNRSFNAVSSRAKYWKNVERGRAAKKAKATGRSLDQLVEDIFEWQTATFVDGTEEGRLKHWEEEIEEWRENLSNGEEAADVFFLFVAIFKHRGIDLRAEAERKLEICKARTWAKTAAGYSKHVTI